MEKICTITDCTRTDINARDMCHLHYARWLRHGDPLGGGRRATQGLAQALSIHSRDQGSCRIWMGADTGDGYGVIQVNGRPTLAHRLAYELANGSIPDGTVIDHICHNRGCVNPNHLRAITQKQNVENNGSPNRRNKSGVRGVYQAGASGKWVAQVCHNYQKHHIGSFATLAEAEAAVIAKRNELFSHNDLDRVA